MRYNEDSWTRKVEYARYTSMRNLRMQNSCFAQFTQQISSVSSEQLRVGVKNWLSWHMIKRTWAWRNCCESERWVISTNWNCKKWTPKYKHPGGMIKQREANKEHAESVRCLVKIQIPDSLPGSGGTRHNWSSSSSQNYMLPLINTESKYRCVNIRRRVQNMDYHFQRPKPLRGRVYHVMIQITLQKMRISESYMRRETVRDIIKHRGNSCVSAKTTIPKFLSQSTKGSGMIFLPLVK